MNFDVEFGLFNKNVNKNVNRWVDLLNAKQAWIEARKVFPHTSAKSLDRLIAHINFPHHTWKDDEAMPEFVRRLELVKRRPRERKSFGIVVEAAAAATVNLKSSRTKPY